VVDEIALAKGCGPVGVARRHDRMLNRLTITAEPTTRVNTRQNSCRPTTA